MRIDITTPIATKVEEKKDAKIIKAKKASGAQFVQETVKAEMESQLKREDPSEAKLISFLEERKKRRAKIKSEAINKYALMQDGFIGVSENDKGKKLNLRV